MWLYIYDYIYDYIYIWLYICVCVCMCEVVIPSWPSCELNFRTLRTILVMLLGKGSPVIWGPNLSASMSIWSGFPHHHNQHIPLPLHHPHRLHSQRQLPEWGISKPWVWVKNIPKCQDFPRKPQILGPILGAFLDPKPRDQGNVIFFDGFSYLWPVPCFNSWARLAAMGRSTLWIVGHRKFTSSSLNRPNQDPPETSRNYVLTVLVLNHIGSIMAVMVHSSLEPILGHC